MANKLTTKELFDMYFEDYSETTAYKIRGQLDRQEIYHFEKIIGKQFIEMNAEEIFKMIMTYWLDVDNKGNLCKSDKMLPFVTYRSLIQKYTKIFDKYIYNCERISNPFYSEELRGNAAYKKMLKYNNPLTLFRLYKFIGKIEEKYTKDFSLYIEMIILLLYHGFKDLEMILNIEEKMIDFDKREVTYDGHTYVIDERCSYLLKYFSYLDTIKIKQKGKLKETELINLENSYVKIINLKTREFDNLLKDKKQIAYYLNFMYLKWIRQLDSDVTQYNVYFLGVYTYIKEKFGTKVIKDFILSNRKRDEVCNKVRNFLAGTHIDSTTATLRKKLVGYIDFKI